jgi:hypothetical protein
VLLLLLLVVVLLLLLLVVWWSRGCGGEVVGQEVPAQLPLHCLFDSLVMPVLVAAPVMWLCALLPQGHHEPSRRAAQCHVVDRALAALPAAAAVLLL